MSYIAFCYSVSWDEKHPHLPVYSSIAPILLILFTIYSPAQIIIFSSFLSLVVSFFDYRCRYSNVIILISSFSSRTQSLLLQEPPRLHRMQSKGDTCSTPSFPYHLLLYQQFQNLTKSYLKHFLQSHFPLYR